MHGFSIFICFARSNVYGLATYPAEINNFGGHYWSPVRTFHQGCTKDRRPDGRGGGCVLDQEILNKKPKIWARQDAP